MAVPVAVSAAIPGCVSIKLLRAQSGKTLQESFRLRLTLGSLSRGLGVELSYIVLIGEMRKNY